MKHNYLDTTNLSVLKLYATSLNFELLKSISNEVVANIVHTIFKEAVRTYEEDLPKNEYFNETHSITTTFYTDIELYNPKYVFWNTNGLDPWYVAITIDDEMDRDLDFVHHNNPCKKLFLSKDKKLDGIFCMMDVYSSHINWRYKFVLTIFKNIYECYDEYTKLLFELVQSNNQNKQLWNEYGTVIDKELANRIYKIYFESCSYLKQEFCNEQINRLNTSEIYLSNQYLDGWRFTDNDNLVCDYGMIINVNKYIENEESLKDNEFDDQLIDWMDDNLLISLLINNKIETFFLAEID